MSRYVDTEYVKAVMLNDRLMQGNAEFTLYAQQVETQVNALPSIDIVRCKECKWYEEPHHKIFENCVKWKESRGIILPIKPNDSCSYGERRG